MKLFGFEIVRKNDPAAEQKAQPTFTPPDTDDGAVVVAAGGVYGTYIDLQGAARTEAELVVKYREMAQHPEVEAAVDDVVNEAIVYEENKRLVDVNLDNTKLSPNIKKLIATEFDDILKLLNYQQMAFDLFRRWYIDGRMYYHAIIDVNKPEEGIKELRYVDPRKIRKVREIKKKRMDQDNTQPGAQVNISSTVQEYFLYNDKGFQARAGEVGTQTSATGLKIAADSIIHVTSGLLDPQGTIVISHLHKAIKPLNQLRALEDATVIYRISRAPERRIFYIDVGNLPKMKAEQYMRDMMQRHKNKVVYDAQTGEIRDDRKFLTMLEDYWLPRREGGRGTEIDTLPAGQNLGELADVEYFQRNLYKSLNVPTSRLDKESTFNFGEDQAISRDEIKFSKFIDRLKMRFNQVFLQALKKQVVLKRIMDVEEWEEIESFVDFNYARDNYYEEQKKVALYAQRLQLMNTLTPYIGKYYSHDWARKNVLQQTDKEIEDMDKASEEELKNPIYTPVFDTETQAPVENQQKPQPPN